ncbi:MAG: alanine racemase, partial [Sphingopyxis sp.]
AGAIRPVVQPCARIIQRRMVRAGDAVGYNATWTAPRDQWVAIVHLGYADGYLRAFSDRGGAMIGGQHAPLIGRVSMDLTAFALADGCDATDGDWAMIDFDLARASRATGLSPYELLTGMGQRYDRIWQ